MNAVRIQVLNSSLVPTGNEIVFIEQEVLQTQPAPVQTHIVRRSQSGKPKGYLVGDAWHEITLNIRIHSADTISKLTTLRNNAKNASLLRIYPMLVDDETLFFDCFISPEIPIYWLMAGRMVVNDTFEILFIEATKDAQGYVGEDIYAE
jgi:hypothetical protein